MGRTPAHGLRAAVPASAGRAPRGMREGKGGKAGGAHDKLRNLVSGRECVRAAFQRTLSAASPSPPPPQGTKLCLAVGTTAGCHTLRRLPPTLAHYLPKPRRPVGRTSWRISPLWPLLTGGLAGAVGSRCRGTWQAARQQRGPSSSHLRSSSPGPAAARPTAAPSIARHVARCGRADLLVRGGARPDRSAPL